MKIVRKTLLASLGITTAIFMSGCGGDDGSVATDVDSKPIYTPAGWYMKTSVSATDPVTSTTYVHQTAGIFGELNESSDGKDKHDIPGYGKAILQVVFVQTEWGKDNGDYFSDYHANSSDDEKKVWTFQVKNEKDVHLENAALSIMVDGVYDVSSLEEGGRISYKETLSDENSKKTALKLVDLDNQQVYTYEELQNAQLHMDGLNIRTFRWVIGEVDSTDYTPLNAVANERSALSKAVAKSTSSDFVFEEKPTVEEVFTSSER